MQVKILAGLQVTVTLTLPHSRLQPEATKQGLKGVCGFVLFLAVFCLFYLYCCFFELRAIRGLSESKI